MYLNPDCINPLSVSQKNIMIVKKYLKNTPPPPPKKTTQKTLTHAD